MCGDLNGNIFCKNGNSVCSDYFCDEAYGQENHRGNAPYGAGGLDYDIRLGNNSDAVKGNASF